MSVDSLVDTAIKNGVVQESKKLKPATVIKLWASRSWQANQETFYDYLQEMQFAGYIDGLTYRIVRAHVI